MPLTQFRIFSQANLQLFLCVQRLISLKRTPQIQRKNCTCFRAEIFTAWQKLAGQESSEALIVCGWWAQVNSIIYYIFLFFLHCCCWLTAQLLNGPSDIPLKTQQSISIILMSRADKLSVLLVHYRPSLLFKFRHLSSVADQYNNWRLQRWLIQAEYANVKLYKAKGVSTVFLTNLVKLWAFN